MHCCYSVTSLWPLICEADVSPTESLRPELLLQVYPPQPPNIGFGLKTPLFVCLLRVREGHTRALRNVSTNPMAFQNVRVIDLSFVSSIRPSRMYGEVIFITAEQLSNTDCTAEVLIELAQSHPVLFRSFALHIDSSSYLSL